MSPARILIIRVAALGDVAVTTVLLNRVRAEAPSARITWLCGEGAAPIVRLCPGVDDVLTVAESDLLASGWWNRLRALARVWRQLLAKGPFDRVLLVHADPRYRALVLPLLGTPVARLRHGTSRMSINPSRYRGDEYARLWDMNDVGPVVARYELADLRPRLGETPERLRSRGARVVLAPGGARNVLRTDGLRRWPVNNFRELAAMLAADGLDVALIGDANDALLTPHFAGTRVTNFMGQLSLPETLQLLRDADATVACDSGPLHLARLVRTPVVGLFGPTTPTHVLGDDAPDVRALWGGAHLACRPCYDGRNYAACANNLCVQSVTVRDAYDAVQALRGLGSSTLLESTSGSGGVSRTGSARL